METPLTDPPTGLIMASMRTQRVSTPSKRAASVRPYAALSNGQHLYIAAQAP